MTPLPRRTGQVNVAWLSFLASLLVLAALVALLAWDHLGSRQSATGQPLFVYCAAGLKRPVEAVARAYESRYGVPVQLTYGGSQTLLAAVEAGQRGDLYLAADDSYIQVGRDKGLLAEVLDLARQTPVLAVKAGNPKKIRQFGDVLAEGVRLSFANPEAAAVGKVARDALQKGGHWEGVRKHVVVFKPTVNDVANDVAIGAVDAGVVWDATVRQTPGLEAVPLAEITGEPSRICAAVLRTTTQPQAALRFARFLASRDFGLPKFKEEGFAVVDGDRWAEEPQLRLLSGAMLRPAIQETLAAFEAREGVRITTVYNGCGILVAQGQPARYPRSGRPGEARPQGRRRAREAVRPRRADAEDPERDGHPGAGHEERQGAVAHRRHARQPVAHRLARCGDRLRQQRGGRGRPPGGHPRRCPLCRGHAAAGGGQRFRL